MSKMPVSMRAPGPALVPPQPNAPQGSLALSRAHFGLLRLAATDLSSRPASAPRSRQRALRTQQRVRVHANAHLLQGHAHNSTLHLGGAARAAAADLLGLWRERAGRFSLRRAALCCSAHDRAAGARAALSMPRDAAARVRTLPFLFRRRQAGVHVSLAGFFLSWNSDLHLLFRKMCSCQEECRP